MKSKRSFNSKRQKTRINKYVDNIYLSGLIGLTLGLKIFLYGVDITGTGEISCRKLGIQLLRPLTGGRKVSSPDTRFRLTILPNLWVDRETADDRKNKVWELTADYETKSKGNCGGPVCFKNLAKIQNLRWIVKRKVYDIRLWFFLQNVYVSLKFRMRRSDAIFLLFFYTVAKSGRWKNNYCLQDLPRSTHTKNNLDSEKEMKKFSETGIQILKER